MLFSSGQNFDILVVLAKLCESLTTLQSPHLPVKAKSLGCFSGSLSNPGRDKPQTLLFFPPLDSPREMAATVLN